MKKRLISLMMVLVMTVVCCMSYDMRADASEVISKEVPLEEIMTENAIIGNMVSTTKGVYLFRGVSIINDAGGGRIGWGAITEAAKTCKVSATAILERLENGSWVRVTSATRTVESGVNAMVSRNTLVGSGYYYRVRGSHYASTDYGTSYTNGLYM